MYLKYLVNRAKTAPSKWWSDWKKFRNFPGMEYYDLHDHLGGLKQERFPSPGSYKNGPDYDTWRFKWDYKTPFRESPYSIRRKRPEVEDDVFIFTNLHIEENEINEQLKLTPAFQEYVSDPRISKIKYTEDVNQIKEEARTMIETNYNILPYRFQLGDNYVSSQMEDLVQRYFPIIENMGENKGTDIVDGAPIFMQLYFDGVTQVENFQKKLQEENEGKMNLYVGRTKIWQTIPDIYGKEEVDKIQTSIKAPCQDQLDEWDQANDQKKIALPFDNNTLKNFRELHEYFEELDHNYERLIFERNKKQDFEQRRNSRYWKQSQNLVHDHLEHSH